MAKFNTTLPKQKTLTNNLAGGKAYKQSPEMAFVSQILTSFVNDQFYRDANTSIQDIKSLISKIDDKEFIAKAAVYVRDKFGMRSISHVVSGELASQTGGKEWAKSFYDKVIIRPDDMTEILSYYLNNKTDKSNPKFPNSLKKGFSKAFDKFDSYQLSKYMNENKEVKLIDVVNIAHPIPSSKNKQALEQLVKGELRNTQTWESKLSLAGQMAENEEDLAKLKGDAWKELITTRKIGYFALLRNLRNIATLDSDVIKAACDILTDEKMVKNSRVLPFRFTTAYEEVSKLPSTQSVRDLLVAINDALEISVSNVPKLDGDTLVVIDVSGSMSGKPSEIASLFGSILAKSNNCDVMTFATRANYVNWSPVDSLMSLRNSFRFSGGGTNFPSIFQTANKAYENIIILSDMQGWIGNDTPVREYNNYKSKFNCNPHIFSWDLQGYSTLQFPENNVYCLAGFSEKVFDVMALLKKDKNALINDIKSVQLD